MVLTASERSYLLMCHIENATTQNFPTHTTRCLPNYLGWHYLNCRIPLQDRPQTTVAWLQAPQSHQTQLPRIYHQSRGGYMDMWTQPRQNHLLQRHKQFDQGTFPTTLQRPSCALCHRPHLRNSHLLWWRCGHPRVHQHYRGSPEKGSAESTLYTWFDPCVHFHQIHLPIQAFTPDMKEWEKKLPAKKN